MESEKPIEQEQCMYTITYKCDSQHDATYCVCPCHDQKKKKTYLPCEIHNDENGILYRGLIDTSPSSSEDDTDTQPRLSTADEIAEIRSAIEEYPLANRPCFEARRSRRIPRTAVASLKISSTVLDDFYLNLLDWGRSNLLALASASTLLLISPDAQELRIGTKMGQSHAPSGNESDDMVDEPLLREHNAERTSLVSASPSTQRVHSADSDFTAVRWSHGGRELAVGTRHGTVEIWDTVEGRLKSSHVGHSHRVGSLDWVPGQPNLVTSGSRDKSIITHDIRSPSPIEHRHDRHKQEVCGLRWKPTEVETPPLTPTQENHLMEETKRTFTSVQEVLDWDWERVTSIPPFSKSDIRKRAAKALTSAFESDEQLQTSMLRTGVPVLASGGNDNKVYIWELGYTIPLVQLSVHTAAVKALAWAPMSLGVLATGGGTNDRTIRIWDVSRGREMGTCETESQVCNLFWSRATLELVSSHGYTLNQVNLWDIRQRVREGSTKPLLLKKLSTLSGHTSRVLYMAGSPDGTRVATAAGDSMLKVWDAFV